MRQLLSQGGKGRREQAEGRTWGESIPGQGNSQAKALRFEMGSRKGKADNVAGGRGSGKAQR